MGHRGAQPGRAVRTTASRSVLRMPSVAGINTRPYGREPLPRARPAAGTEPLVRPRATRPRRRPTPAYRTAAPRRGAEPGPGQPRPSVSHRPGAVRNQGPRGYPHSVPSFVPRPLPQSLPSVVHSLLWTTSLPDPGYPQGWAHVADPGRLAGYQPPPAPEACGKPAFPPLSQPVVRREHTGCGLPLPQRGRTSSSTAPLRRGTAPRHPAQEVVPTCGQLCGKTA